MTMDIALALGSRWSSVYAKSSLEDQTGENA